MARLDENDGKDWRIGFHGASLRPFAILDCPACGARTFFEPGDGRTPKAFCCKDEPAYPTGAKWQAHLTAKPQVTPEKEAENNGKPVALRVIRPSFVLVKERKAASLFRHSKKKV